MRRTGSLHISFPSLSYSLGLFLSVFVYVSDTHTLFFSVFWSLYFSSLSPAFSTQPSPFSLSSLSASVSFYLSLSVFSVFCCCVSPVFCYSSSLFWSPVSWLRLLKALPRFLLANPCNKPVSGVRKEHGLSKQDCT